MTPIRLNMDKAMLAVSDGLNILCATCTHYWEAKDANHPQCKHAEACGGPFMGRFYPRYDGPFPATAHGHFCFVCGSDQVRGQLVRRNHPHAQGLGVCHVCAPKIPGVANEKAKKQCDALFGVSRDAVPRNSEEYLQKMQALRDQFNPSLGLLFREADGALVEFRALRMEKPKTLSALLNNPEGTP